jgi:hypothetical protein
MIKILKLIIITVILAVIVLALLAYGDVPYVWITVVILSCPLLRLLILFYRK